MSLVKKICLGAVVLLVLAQFIRPARNLSTAAPGPTDIVTLHPPPPAVQRVLERACYDCHSDHTRYPWYADIEPVGWWLAHHVREGKRELNFSHFGDLPPTRATRKLTKSIDEVEKHGMPLPSYTWVHRDARLSPEEIAALGAWARQARSQINAAAATGH